MSEFYNTLFHPSRTNAAQGARDAERRFQQQEMRLAEQDKKQDARAKSLREDQDARLRAIRAMQGGRPTLLQTSETGVGTKTTLGG
jgi:hypothetical protein